MLVDRPALGAPGVYAVATPPPRALLGVRMDVCAFVGLAPRGPAWVRYTDEQWLEQGTLRPDRSGGPERSGVEPERPRRRSIAVAVESWDEYRRLYGGFDGPGRLPYAVASFFEQGGRRAYIVRVVHDYGGGDVHNRLGVARGPVGGLAIDGRPRRLWLRARDDGSWGNGLRAELTFSARPLSFISATDEEIVLPPGTVLEEGTLLRLSLVGGARVLRFVAAGRTEPRLDAPGRHWIATLDTPAPAAPVAVEVVEAALEASDSAGRRELLERIGLGAAHARRLALVLARESSLLQAAPSWADADLLPLDARLEPLASTGFHHGKDRYEDLVPDDFFDSGFVLGDEGPADGVHAVLDEPEIATVVVPDLYDPSPLPELDAIVDPPNLAGATFEPCADPVPGPPQDPPPAQPLGLMLDPAQPVELGRILAYQQRLVELAETTRAFIVLLDVPPRLDQRRILAWRASFDSAWAAGYHPWVDVVRTDDKRTAKVRLNPSAVAAGIVAQRERLLGIAFGAANELGVRVVDVADRVSSARHDELHQSNVNVFLRERDGIRLTASRTLSRGLDYRQLSVRRLVTMIERTLERELQWLVFEPNADSLRAEVRHLVTSYLRRLFRAGSFAGATEAQSFFVRCDEQLNPQSVVDEGRLVAEIGVAPVEPVEFIVVRITRDGDGTLLVEGSGG